VLVYRGGPGLKFGRVGKPGKVYMKVLDKVTKKPVTVPVDKISLEVKGPSSI